jgi:hypothetical protein
MEKTTEILTRQTLEDALLRMVTEVAGEPEYRWDNGFCSYMTESDGQPVVRLGVANCSADMDIWQGLRNPAQVGMYPIGLRDIWMHYATANVRSTREDGSPNPLALPETYEEALKRYRRAVIVSAILAFNPEIHELYAHKIEAGDADPPAYHRRARNEVAQIIDKAVGKLALSLMSPVRAVVPMTRKNVEAIVNGTRSEYHLGRYHGPCNTHFPQNSVAVMTGLLRFGANRLPFRDEVGADGKVRRLFGSYASIIIFDEEDVVTNGSNGIGLHDAETLAWKIKVNNYADTAPEIVAQRYCTYNMEGEKGTSACGMCIQFCPSGALANSTPQPDGTLDERIMQQKHRFWEEILDFDYGNCSRDRNQKARLYDDYVCGRCEAICAARGLRKSADSIRDINGN